MTGAPQDPLALVGQVLDGHYRVDAVVGEGGCGVVYKGWHIAFEQPIAIKALKMPEVNDAETRIGVLSKFREEAKLSYVLSQASLSIVRCIGYGALVTPTQAWAPYHVLEWLDGRPLSEELEDRKRRGAPGRSLSEAMTLLSPVAAGLTYAHSQRVAHRDVKPGNLFLVGEGSPGATLKILDFGIAKVMEEGATASSAPWTRGGVVSFTPYYAAPEQLDPRFGPTGPWTDVYGFALVMVEVLAGTRPIRGADVVSVIAQATNVAQRPTPRALGVSVPDAVESAFARALALDPKARFVDVGAFWQALTHALRLGTSGRHEVGGTPGAGWVLPAHTVPMATFASPSGSGSRPPGAPTIDMRSTPAPDRGVPLAPGRTAPLGLPSSDPSRSSSGPPGAGASVPPPRKRRAKAVWWVVVVLVLASGGAYALLEYAR